VLWAELLVLFAAIPTAFWWTRMNQGVAAEWLAGIGLTGRLAEAVAGGRLMIPTLLFFGVFCLLVLIFDKRFENTRLWNIRAGLRDLPRILLVFVGVGGAVSLLVWQSQPGSWLAGLAPWWPTVSENAAWLRLPREAPIVWGVIMVFYPVFSVWPQEVIYRAYFHHRYRSILAPTLARVLVGALVFGFMHIVFLNWLAPVMTLGGGLLFAWTYERTKSLFAASIEHALWGNLVFTTGIGWYFYGGNMGA